MNDENYWGKNIAFLFSLLIHIHKSYIIDTK